MAALKLLCVLAHPDDETLGFGGTLARCADAGIETYLVTATRGERGWSGGAYPGAEQVARVREAELARAADVLRLREVAFLDYIDGDLDQASPADVIAQITTHIRRLRPQVVATFDPFGAYGHPDHIAISQFTTAAAVAAADRSYPHGGLPHRIAKLYYRALTQAEIDNYQSFFGQLTISVDGLRRGAPAWPDWSVTTRIDTAAYREQVWAAARCHESQVGSLPAAMPDGLFAYESFYRALSFVSGGRQIETDLFDGVYSRAAYPTGRVI